MKLAVEETVEIKDRREERVKVYVISVPKTSYPFVPQ
jgi:hypothetical protein